jgi:hypothetical protein
LDENAIWRLRRDDRLARAECVNPLPDHLDRAVQRIICDWPGLAIGICGRLQTNQERCAAGEIDALFEPPMLLDLRLSFGVTNDCARCIFLWDVEGRNN